MNHKIDHKIDPRIDPRIDPQIENQPIENLLRHRHLWRAADGIGSERGTLSTGFEPLDAELAGGGWPMDGLTEILGDTPGVGELRLLLPALARLSQRRARWIAWIAPPYLPYAPALAAAGIDVGRVLLVHPRNHQDQLWATEQALKSGTCSAVLSWPDPHHLRHGDLRRLQIAAREGDAWGVLFRPLAAAATASPAELRLQIETGSGDAERLALRVLKRRGGWPTEALDLQLRDPLTRRLAGPQQAAALRQLALWQPAGSFVGRVAGRTPRRGAQQPRTGLAALHPVSARTTGRDAGRGASRAPAAGAAGSSTTGSLGRSSSRSSSRSASKAATQGLPTRH